MVKNFICDRYGGIRQKTAQFSENVITCSDMQNVELFYSGINNGVGIRTTKGQQIIKALPNGERIVNLFQSVQNGKNNCFIHAISENETVYELSDGSNIAYSPIAGLLNNNFSTEETLYKNPDCSTVFGNLSTTLDIVSSNSDLIINNNYIGTKDSVGTEIKTFKYKNLYSYDKSLLNYYGEIENNFDKFTGKISGFSSNNSISLNDLNYNLFEGDVTYPSAYNTFKEIADSRECLITVSDKGTSRGFIEIYVNGIKSSTGIYTTDFSDYNNSFRFGKIKTYRDSYNNRYHIYIEVISKQTLTTEQTINAPIWTGYDGEKLDHVTSILFKIGGMTTGNFDGVLSLSESYICDNEGNKHYFSEIDHSGWFENENEISLKDYSIEVLGNPLLDDSLTLTYTTKQILLNNFKYTGNTEKGYSKLYLYDFATEALVNKIGLKRQLVSSGVDYKQGYDDCFVFCNKEEYLYKIQLNKSVTAYQVKCDDIIGYVAENGIDTIASGKIVYSDTNLSIEYKTIKTVYQVKYDDSIGYIETQGTQGDYLPENTVIYSDTKLTQVLAEASGYDYTYTGQTDLDYKFNYTGYVDNEISILKIKDAENREIKPDFITTCDNRIQAAIKNRLHTCVQQNIFDWESGDTDKPTSAYYIEFSKNITAIAPYLGSSLAVFFKDSSLLVKGSYPELQVTEESPGGCANYKSLVFHGTDLFFYDHTKKGIYSFQQVVLGNKTLGKDIAIEVNNYLDLIDESRLEDLKFSSYVSDDRNEIWFLLPTNDKNYSTILIYDYLRNEWIKRKSKKIYCVETINNILLSGGKNLYQEYVNNDFAGEFIQHYYNCTPFNLGSNTSMKILYLRPRMSVALPYNNEFYVKYAKNFDNFKKPKIKKVKSKFKNYLIWGQGKWGENYWAGGTTNSILKLPNVSAFKTLNISFYTENSLENFAIRNMEMNQVDSIQT